MDRGAQWARVHGVTKSQTRLSNGHFDFLYASVKPSLPCWLDLLDPLLIHVLDQLYVKHALHAMGYYNFILGICLPLNSIL